MASTPDVLRQIEKIRDEAASARRIAAIIGRESDRAVVISHAYNLEQEALRLEQQLKPSSA